MEEDGRRWKKMEEDGRRWKKMEEVGRKKSLQKITFFSKKCRGPPRDLSWGTKGPKKNIIATRLRPKFFFSESSGNLTNRLARV